MAPRKVSTVPLVPCFRLAVVALGLSFNAGSDDTRDAPSAKIIRELNRAGYTNIVAYDPVATKEFQAYYKFNYRCVATSDEVLEQADVIAIATAWPEFGTLRERTNKPIVDCRYML